MVAHKAGHEKVKNKLQPVRMYLLSHLDRIETKATFEAVRKLIRLPLNLPASRSKAKSSAHRRHANGCVNMGCSGSSER